MVAERLAQVRDGLVEAQARGEDCCVTFEAALDAGAWIQVVGRSLNCAYRNRQEPSVDALPRELVAAVGGATLLQWEAGNFVTYEVGSTDAEPLARLVDAIFTDHLGCAADRYRLEVRHEQF